MSDRLCVTGLGLTTALGIGVEATWSRLVRGDRALRPIELFDVSGQRVGIGAEIRDLPWPKSAEGRAPMSRTTAMAACAAEEALSMASLVASGTRMGLVVGGTTGGMFETEELLARLHVEPHRDEALRAMLSHPLTATTDFIERQMGPFARVRTVSSACSSGANAIVVAASWLLAGDVDVVLAGGCDALCRLTLSGFNALMAIDPEPCRPFDRRRRGTSLGEGAGFLVLERRRDAVARGARPVADLAGWASGAEAFHITNPEPGGLVVGALIQRAIERAGLTPADIDYVNAHGTGTLANDSTEATALGRALGAEIGRVPVSSSKGQLGHTLGAAGAIEAAITALVVSRRILVPTAGLDEPDPELALVHVPHVGRAVPRVRAALSNAFGFGGMDAVLVFSEARGPAGREEPGRRQNARRVVVTGSAVFGPGGSSGVEGCASLLDGASPREPPSVDPDEYLDPQRSRKLDPSARLAIVAAARALADAKAPVDGTGVILGSAFGAVDESAAFMHRILEKGPRWASPAEFPNLVPSGSVGHLSIYAHLQGPAFCAADLGVSGESAVVQAAQLIQAGEAPRMLAGASEVRGGLVEHVLSALLEPTVQAGASRRDIAAVVLLEEQGEAHRRGARVLARVARALEWRGDGADAVGRVDGPRSRGSEVIVARPDPAADAWLARTPWSACRRLICAPAVGESHGLGALAVAVAAARIGSGRVEEALVLGLAEGRGYAMVFARDERP